MQQQEARSQENLFPPLAATEPAHPEPPRSEPQWPSLSGRILEGGYELAELAQADESGARFRVRVLGDRSLDALVYIFRAEGGEAEQQVGIWDAARQLQHPNLHAPLASGRTELDGFDLIYVVYRKSDEILADALRARALNAKEAGEVFLSLSRALDHLLKNGFVHGCVSPEQIFAVGDSIQLSTMCLRRIGSPPPIELTPAKYTAPESNGANVTPAADVWCLGAAIFESLTQRDCAPGCRELPARPPVPFSLAKVVQSCLTPDPQSRPDLAQLQTLYKGEPKPPAPVPNPVLVPVGARPGPRRVREAERNAPSKIWIYGAVVGLILLIVFWAALSRRSKPATPVTAVVPPATAPNNTAAPPVHGSAWETRTLGDTSAAKLAPHAGFAAASSRAAANRTQPTNGQIWRVVLYTYNHEADAQNKARALNGKHPSLRAEVFSPNTHGGPYLVTAGGSLTHDAAARLRQKARSMGMPRDSYIQNYTH